MRLCFLVLTLLVSNSAASFVFATEVINCSETDVIQPFVAAVDLRGQVSKRYQLNGLKPAIGSIFGDVVGEGVDILLQGSDNPANWPPGNRQVLLRLHQHNFSVVGRDTITIRLSGDATPEQKLWAEEHSGGRALPAVWFEDIGNKHLLFSHRTLTYWTGEPQVELDEWALLVDSTTRPYVAKLVYNHSQTILGTQPLPAAYFGDEHASDTARGILYLQAHVDGRTADIIAARSNIGATKLQWQSEAASSGGDILVWNTSSHAELRRIPLHGIALRALHFDPVMDRLRALILEPSSSNQTSEFTLVEVNTATGALHPLRSFSVPSPLKLQSRSISAFDLHTGTLALLFVEPTDSTDWSHGDPKTAWVLELQTRDVTDKDPAGGPHKIALLTAAGECTSSEAETRLYRPTLSYVPEPAWAMYVV